VRFVFGLTIGLGACLLFWQELILGRMLLPKFGGVPTVWLVSLAFFQTILLAAYALVHRARHWKNSTLFLLLVGLLCASALQQIFLPSVEAPSQITPFAVVAALTGLAAFSLFLLSMISPILQKLYARLPQPDAADPYFLYSVSNFGSFAGLLLFPLVLDPLFGLAMSQKMWLIAAGVFVLLLLLSLYLAKDAKSAELAKPIIAPKTDIKPVEKSPWLLWLFYAFLPSSLSFGATAHLINDVAPVPLISMVPLALYLLTFVWAFGPKTWVTDFLIGLQPLFVAVYVLRLAITHFYPSSTYDLLLVLGVFFLTALQCHGRLAARRPPTGDLTFYYVIVALGGALGALFNLMVVPFLFPLALEFVFFLLLSLFMDSRKDWHNFLKLPYRLYIVLGMMALLCLGGLFFQRTNSLLEHQIMPYLLGFTLLYLSSFRAMLGGFSLSVVVLMFFLAPLPLNIQRDFFGVKQVTEKVFENNTYRTLIHGTTTHGMQQRTPVVSTRPLLYYIKGGGVADVFAALKPKHTAIVGLGAGTLSCMAGGKGIRYFEIDPGIVHLAQTYFTYLQACPPDDIIVGDARLTLAQDQGVYDLLVIDAFSSDTIPVHLLTKEAFALYKARLREGGVLVLHLSNRWLDLRPVVVAAAHTLGWGVYFKEANPSAAGYSAKSHYAVLTADQGFLEKLATHYPAWENIGHGPSMRWTDDQFSLIPLFKKE
jgi:spermidine synthase